MLRTTLVLLFLVSAFLVTALDAQAAAPDLDWHELYGDTLADIGYWVETHSTYGYVVSGYEDFECVGTSDAFLMRLDEYGDTLWMKSYGDTLDQGALSVMETPDGGYILSGYTERVPANIDAYFIRTDAGGDTVWTSNFDYGEDEFVYRVLQTPDMGFIGVGFSSSVASHGSTDVFVIKIDEDGEAEWKNFYGGLGHNRGYGMCATGDGDYAITGYTEMGSDRGEVFILKIDGDNGDSLWMKTYGDTTRDIGRSIRETPDSGLIVAGSRLEAGYAYTVGYLIRTDVNGDSLWTRDYGNYDEFLALSGLQITADRGFICAGYRDTSSTGDSDFYFLKTDPGGDVQWTKMIGKNEREDARCVAIADDLGYVAAGYSRAVPGSDFNIYIMKLEGDDAGVGRSQEIPAPGLLTIDGASPFTSDVALRYEVAAAGHVRLTVYDVTGREVATLADGPRGAGSHRATWDLGNAGGERMPSGVYFIRCALSGACSVKKVVVVR